MLIFLTFFVAWAFTVALGSWRALAHGAGRKRSLGLVPVAWIIACGIAYATGIQGKILLPLIFIGGVASLVAGVSFLKMFKPDPSRPRGGKLSGPGALVFVPCAMLLMSGAVGYLFIRSFSHPEQDALAATACASSVGHPVSPKLARLMRSIPDFDRTEETRAWLECVASSESSCGRHSFSSYGILSALPNRYSVGVGVADGVVTECNVRSAPGW